MSRDKNENSFIKKTLNFVTDYDFKIKKNINQVL